MMRAPKTAITFTAIVLAATLVSACGESSSDVDTLPIWDGVGDFYDVPEPLASGRPGDLVRVERLTIAGDIDRVTLRVMYHTRDSQDRDIAATGIITYPLAPPPAGGWPVVSYGHGTSGLAPPCAPSRQGSPPPSFGVQGVLVAPDYAGLGPNGQRHSYLSGRSEGQSVIDLVRAARNVPDAGAGKEWVSIGESQGGHAVLFADELADSYAPELELIGTVAVAPGAELSETFPGDTQVVISVVTVLGLFGIAVDHPQIDPADYASPELLAASTILDTGCLGEATGVILAIPNLFSADPRTTEPARSVLLDNDPARRATSAPLLLVQGDADVVVVPARTDALLARLCGLGAEVELVTIPGAGHDVLRQVGSTVVAAWLNARLAGEPSGSSCALVGATMP